MLYKLYNTYITIFERKKSTVRKKEAKNQICQLNGEENRIKKKQFDVVRKFHFVNGSFTDTC